MNSLIIAGLQISTILIAYFWGRASGVKAMERKILKAEAKQWEAENELQKRLNATAQEADHIVNNGDVVGELYKHGEIRPDE